MEPSPPATERVLGVDPGTIRLGYGLLEGRSARISHLRSGVIAAPATWGAARRLGAIAQELEAVIAAEQPKAIALEASFFGKNAQSLIRLGEARGMVLALAGRHGLEVFDYPPASVKKSVTGHGSASKEQIARVLAALLPDLGKAPEGDRLDRTDAIAVAWCHLHHHLRADLAARIAAATKRR